MDLGAGWPEHWSLTGGDPSTTSTREQRWDPTGLQALVSRVQDEGIKRVAADSRTLEELIGQLTASYPDLGQQPNWCLLSSDFQLYATRVGLEDSEDSSVYEGYRDRLSALLEEAFLRFDFRGELSARQLASALIGLAQGLALERAASKMALPMEVTGMAIRALLFGALRKTP